MKRMLLHTSGNKGGGADLPLFETIETNTGTQKNELQQWALVWQLL